MNPFRTGTLLALLLLAAGSAAALPPDPWDPWGDQDLAFRLLLGSLDGNENSRLLRNDSQRYTVGVSATSPVGWDKRLEADLEIWVNERGYPGAVTGAGEATDTLSYQATALTYGLRAHTLTAVRPYGLFTVGFQANRLEARLLASPVNVKEETLVPTAQLGLGVEWVAGQDLFSIDWRHWFAKGDFTEFGTRGLDLGGNFIGIGLGHRW